MEHKNLQGQKFALLIGVSECDSGFKPLHCPPNSIRELREVLIDPNIGGFSPENVQSLTNPDVGTMQSVLGIFFANRKPNDLILFYFTGHGVKDEHGDFFFTTLSTSKFENGSLNQGTAVSANLVRKLMVRCYSRRQIAILDCCFSGAFPDGVVAMDDQTVDVKRQLLSEDKGRAILTAAASTNYALEQEGEDISVYTRYLIEGLRTGTASPSNQKMISVGDIHKYIREKLQTAAGSMSPQIYSAQEGDGIILARKLIDNETIFREYIENYYYEYNGRISPNVRILINEERKIRDISEERFSKIENEVAAPYLERDANLKKYEKVRKDAIEEQYPLSSRTEKELAALQRIWKLRDEDVQPIKEQLDETYRDIRPDTKYSWEKKSTNLIKRVVYFLKRRFNRINLLTTLAISTSMIVILVASRFCGQPPRQERFNQLLPVSSVNIPEAIIDKASFGEKILVNYREACSLSEDFEVAKEAGRVAMASPKDYETAEASFQTAFNLCSNDPETLIYLNNAKIGLDRAYNIAIPLPISGGDIGNVLMMLRGFAQAQDMINSNGGVNGRSLRLLVIDDNDSEETARQIANSIVDSDFSAVLGHWSSDTTRAAAEIYSRNKLTFITPISIFDRLSEYVPHVFRLSATSNKGIEKLNAYILKELTNQEEVFIFFDTSNPYTEELKEKLALSLQGRFDGNSIGFIDFNSNFQMQPDTLAESLIDSVENKNPLVIFFPSNKSAKTALEVIKEVRDINSEVLIVGDMANLYIAETLNDEIVENSTGLYTKGIVLAPSWNIDANRDSIFVRAIDNVDSLQDEYPNLEKPYWQGSDVNYAAAMSYTALESISEAIKTAIHDNNSPVRADISEALVEKSFEVNGAFQKPITFKKTGESTVEVQLVRVCQTQENNSSKLKFKPISLDNSQCPID